MKNRKVFVSGGAGVIGRELVKKLHFLGAIVWVGDLKPRPQDWPQEILYRQGDLNQLTRFEVEQFKPEIFIHLAATFERSTETFGFWEENFANNVLLSHHLMTLLKEADSLKRVVFASSYLIYNPELYNHPEPQKSAYRLAETDPILPRNLTGVAKLSHEIELRFLNGFCREKFTSISARIFRGYGRGSKCVISRWVRDLLEEKEIKVYNKEGLFDYIFSEDIATGLIQLAELDSIEGIINLGLDSPRRVKDIVEILKIYFPNMKHSEHESDIFYEASQANMEIFQNLTGWCPSIQLEESIPQIIEYEKKQFEKEVKNEKNILMTSISKKIPMIKAVKLAAAKINPKIKVYGGDLSELCIGKYFVDVFWKMPRLSDLSTEELVEYCKLENIGYIIPTRDGELLYFADKKSELAKAGIEVMVSDLADVNFCYDKYHFFTESFNKKLPAIQTSLSIDEIDSERLVVKDRYGAGSANIGLNLSRKDAVEFAKKLENPIYQPFIEGEEASIDFYFDKNGNAKGYITRMRNLVVNGESQVSTTFYNEKLNALCDEFCEKTHFYGHIVMQVLMNKNGSFIIECNPRFGGASSLSISAGLDSFYWFLTESLGLNINECPFIYNQKEPKTQVIYPSTFVI
jgi:carbamoyl-phosphate synthase large subunit